jgi:hypothetical protein
MVWSSIAEPETARHTSGAPGAGKTEGIVEIGQISITVTAVLSTFLYRVN